MRLILLTALFSLTQIALADTSKSTMDITAANQAHAAVNAGIKPLGTNKDKPFWSSKQIKQAELEKKYQEDIAKNPDNKKTYAYLAGLYLTNNKTTKAIDAYQDAITHDSENPKLFAALSIAYLHHAKYDMAKAMADHALKLDPKLKGVKKINEYVVAKKEAIEAASRVPAHSKNVDMTKSTGLHGSVMSTATGVKPTDKIHTPH